MSRADIQVESGTMVLTIELKVFKGNLTWKELHRQARLYRKSHHGKTNWALLIILLPGSKDIYPLEDFKKSNKIFMDDIRGDCKQSFFLFGRKEKSVILFD